MFICFLNNFHQLWLHVCEPPLPATPEVISSHSFLVTLQSGFCRHQPKKLLLSGSQITSLWLIPITNFQLRFYFIHQQPFRQLITLISFTQCFLSLQESTFIQCFSDFTVFQDSLMIDRCLSAFLSVLVNSCCYNKMPRLDGLNKRHLFFQGWQLGGPRPGSWQIWFLEKVVFLAADSHHLLCTHMTFIC